MDLDDAGPETVREMEPVNALLEERVAARHLFVVAPVVGSFQSMGDGREVREYHVAERSGCDEAPKVHRERLVVVVLADQHDPVGAIPRRDHCLVIVYPKIRRLLHQHMLARGESSQRQRQVIAWGDCDDDRIDGGIVDRRRVIAVETRAAEFPAEGVRLVARPARVAARDLAAKRLQVVAVDACNESAAEKRDTQGTQRGVSVLDRDSGFGIRDSKVRGSGFEGSGFEGSGFENSRVRTSRYG